MICVQDNGSGLLQVVSPQPVEVTSCVLVVGSPSEMSSPFALSVEDGSAVAAAVAGVWIIGWVFKALIVTLRGGSNETVDE